MVTAGQFHELTVLRFTEFGAYLNDGADGVLLPRRFVPEGLAEGDTIRVFIYHDSEDRLIATTQLPLATLGEIARLKVVSLTPQGAFLDWGLMKDIFVPKSKMISNMRPQGEYLVKIYSDEKTGRVAATEKFEHELSNDHLTVMEKQAVQLMVLRSTQIGFLVIINNRHTGVLHFNEVFRQLAPGDKFEGFIKKIHENNNIDVVAGKAGYERVNNEGLRILEMLRKAEGFLPFHDKSEPDDIYQHFGMSKKTFKMTLGNLYKQKKIILANDGIRLV